MEYLLILYYNYYSSDYRNGRKERIIRERREDAVATGSSAKERECAKEAIRDELLSNSNSSDLHFVGVCD
jgi:hypothetical protein